MSTDSQRPFPKLLAIDRLEVGPVRLEKRRLVAPYTVSRDGMRNSTELIFRYETDVFTPAEAASRNLANMIAAQVALNYGLFCHEIIFHGDYDESDRTFLREMADNTATEIYVNKLLQPNPFLRGAAVGLPVLQRESYLQAKLLFPDASADNSGVTAWETDHQKYAILSSGGKDSLLSYGVLDEMGYEVHPIFGNESGRHWFTALNAYRYFREKVPFTGRVWMNSDRLFAWMLRQLPFIRSDFASVRADIYPIRLWTVAVFLFSIIPLLRRRGIGRVVIGDEYDSTWTESFQGIQHYCGLYDQSIWFDEALTGYFRKKKWQLQQFSVLRPLSELLILKTLTQRYPELQQHQVSCHAAHKEGERVHPCGKCEKCRRIVGMLVAFDGDPRRCGYSEKQIESCLAALLTRGIHQEAEGANHLLYLLLSKKRVQLPEGVNSLPEPQPNVMRLRIHPERSALDYLPEDIRRALFSIFLEHAEGAVIYRGEHWQSIDLMAALRR